MADLKTSPVSAEAVSPPKNNLTIAIWGYCTPIVPAWDPDVLNQGIGGSEEAIIHVGRVLARRGYHVTVFAQPPAGSRWSLPEANPQYLPAEWFLHRVATPFDVVLCWRRTQFSTAKLQSRTVFYWPHDVPQRTDTDQEDHALTAVFYLSEYQRTCMEAVVPTRGRIPYCISGNGITDVLALRQKTVDQPEVDTMLTAKPRTSCVYISNWARGLHLLLNMWPTVRQKVPTATLDIYYGTQTWGCWSADETARAVKRIEELAPLGVRSHGMVGQDALDVALQRSSVLAYPCCCYAETYCISVVKAQYWGNIPVTSQMGALVETTRPGAPVVPRLTTTQDLAMYENLLIATLQRLEGSDPTLLCAERKTYMSFAAQRTWDDCVDRWVPFFPSLSSSSVSVTPS